VVAQEKERLNRAKLAAEAAWEKQAEDVLVLDLRSLCHFADFFVICSAPTDRQIEAIRDEVSRRLKEEGLPLLHSEGEADSGWVLLDFGDVLVHIFAPEQREYYALEKIWHRAQPVLRLQ